MKALDTSYPIHVSGDHGFKFIEKEFEQSLGIIFFMSVTKLPSNMGLKKFWNKCSAIGSKEFANLYILATTAAPARDDPDWERLYGIRPLIDMLNLRLGLIPKLAYFSADEQMCSTKMFVFISVIPFVYATQFASRPSIIRRSSTEMWPFQTTARSKMINRSFF